MTTRSRIRLLRWGTMSTTRRGCDTIRQRGYTYKATTTKIHLQGYDNENTTTRLRKQLLIRHGGELKMRGVMSWATMNREKSQTQWMAKWDYSKRYIARRSALILTFTCPPSSRRWVLDCSLAPSTGQWSCGNGLFRGYWTEGLWYYMHYMSR